MAPNYKQYMPNPSDTQAVANAKSSALSGMFSRRSVTQRPTPTLSPPTLSKAVVDTAGMDPEMKETLGGMRGAVGAGNQNDPFAGVKNLYRSTVNWIGSLSHGGANNGTPTPPPPDTKTYN